MAKRLLACSLLVAGVLLSPLAALSLMTGGQPAVAQTQPAKLALIIGNKDYRADPLTNTLNDARDMAAKLRGLGFQVVLKENLPDEKAMKRAIREVTSQIRSGDVFLFYYSGHAMDVKGVNYLLPTQAEINKEVDVEYEALNFNLVLDEIEAARGQANLVILDSCRNNPFVQRVGRSANKGLAITRSPSGTYIIYATAPGKVASDNPNGRNGLFTQALLESLDKPGLTQDQVFRQTARKVRDASKGSQEPWAGGSLIDDFYFKPLSSTPPPTPAPQSYQSESLSNSLGMDFKRIPSGSFMMGSPTSEKGRDGDERQYRVTLTEDYYMQTTEVTQAQWQAVMGNNPSLFKGSNLPVEEVSWEDVQLFVSKLNARGEGTYRLPTEAEWEYAARAGSSTRYACGDSESCVEQMGWFYGNSGNQPHPVAQKAPNAWGLYDMHGNVNEWVQDWYGDYPSGSSSNPRGASTGSNRVFRGGSWFYSARSAQSASRRDVSPAYRSALLGFRLLRLP